MINDPSFQMFDQWQAQKQAMIQMWADVYVYSSLAAEQVTAALLKPTSSIEGTLQQLMERYGRDASIAVMPQGPLTIPYIVSN